MRRSWLLSFLLLLGSLGVAAQDKPVSPASLLSGGLSLGVDNGNLLGSPFVAGIPGVSADLSSASLSLKFSDTQSRSYLDLYQADQDFVRSTRPGYEFGVVFDAANLYRYVKSSSKLASNGDSSFYSLIQPMIDWYEDNHARFGMPESPYATGQWPADNYDSSSSGRTRFIRGTTVEPMSFVAWDYTKWYDAQKLESEIKLKIELAIDGISPDAASGEIIDQYAYAAMTSERQALARRELEAWTDFHLVSDGTSSSAKLEGPLVKQAWIAFTNLGGTADLRLDFSGKSFANGQLVSSPRTGQPATGPALGLALPVGLVPGFDLSLAADLVGGKASIVEDWETKDSEVVAGEPSWLGLRLKAAYSLPDTASIEFSLLAPDLVERPLTLAATLDAKAEGRGFVDYSALVEGSFLFWQDRYLENPANVLAYAAGLDARAEILGFAPRVLALYKSAGYWGLGGNQVEDRLPGASLRGDFDAVKVNDAAAVEAGLSFDPADFLGVSFLEVGGGYRALLYAPTTPDYSIPGQGWFADFEFDLQNLADLPLALTLEASSYENWGLYAGQWSDWNAAPAPGLLTALSWSARLDFAPLPGAGLALEASGRPSGYRMDSVPLVSIGATASLKF